MERSCHFCWCCLPGCRPLGDDGPISHPAPQERLRPCWRRLHSTRDPEICSACSGLVSLVCLFSALGCLVMVFSPRPIRPGAIDEVSVTLWPTPGAVYLPLGGCQRYVAAPYIKQALLCFLGLSLAGRSRGFMSRGGAPFLSVSGRSQARSRAPFVFLFGATATCILILVLWQTGFTGIRVGEASNPGPTVSASNGVTTPLPPSQDRDLMETSSSGPLSQSLAPLVPAPSSGFRPPQAPSTRPSRFCSFSQSGSAARRPSCPAGTVLLRPPLMPTSPPVLPLLAPALGSSALPSLVPTTLPSHGWATFSSMMLTLQGSSLATSRWIGFVDRASA